MLTIRSIHNTERNLDLASNQNRLAAEKAREIKTLNVRYLNLLSNKQLAITNPILEVYVRCTC